MQYLIIRLIFLENKIHDGLNLGNLLSKYEALPAGWFREEVENVKYGF